MGLTTQLQAVTAEQLSEMREWIWEAFEDAPEDLTDTETLRAVARHYAGGVSQFIADAFGRYTEAPWWIAHLPVNGTTTEVAQ